MSLCQYQFALGKPNEGIHATRFLGLAAFDLLGLIFLIFIISYSFNTQILPTTLVLSILTIFVHWLFCVPTALNVALFSE